MSALALRSSGSWLDHVKGKSGSRLTAIGAEGGHALRQVGGGALAGALMGVVAGRTGSLDFKVSAKAPAVPVDLALAVAGIGLGIVFAEHAFSDDFRHAGTAGATIFAYRQVEKLVTAARLRPNAVAPTAAQDAARSTVRGEYEMGADVSNDAILSMAQSLT
jgi:hypothetical protein